MKYLLFILAINAFCIQELSRKEIKEFLSSYDMLKTGYDKGNYQQVVFFGKKTMEDFKVIPLDNRERIVKDLQPKYLEIFYLIAKSELHLSLKTTADSSLYCRKTKDYGCVEAFSKKIIELIQRSGILERHEEPEKPYFSNYLENAQKSIDSIPVWVEKDFALADMAGKEKLAVQFKDRMPHLLRIVDSLSYEKNDELYYTLMNGKDIKAIEAFITLHPTFDKLENLKNHVQSLISDDYKYAIQAKDIKVYQNFIDRYPESTYRREIESRLEYQIMKEAIQGQSMYYCQMYMDTYPKGKYLQEVVATFEKLSRGEKEDKPQVPKVR